MTGRPWNFKMGNEGEEVMKVVKDGETLQINEPEVLMGVKVLMEVGYWKGRRWWSKWES